MIKNTTAFYKRAEEYQNKRAELVSNYESTLRSLERYKGSSGYSEEVEELRKKHEEELKLLQDEYRGKLHLIMDGMEEAIGKRKVNPPTNEQLNLIHLLKMREKVTVEELDRVAEMVKDNGIALGVVQEIAHDNEIMKNYTHLCAEMTSEMALGVVRSMREGLEDWIQYDTGRAGRLANAYYSEHYGTPERELPKRPLFHDVDECFRELAGLDSERMELFSEVVDAKGE